jgi:hypothetical protein
MQHEIDYWDDLRTLISVAHAGSLAGAGGALGSHRSTVLLRIERLEARLGLRLLTGRSMKFSKPSKRSKSNMTRRLATFRWLEQCR